MVLQPTHIDDDVAKSVEVVKVIDDAVVVVIVVVLVLLMTSGNDDGVERCRWRWCVVVDSEGGCWHRCCG